MGPRGKAATCLLEHRAHLQHHSERHQSLAEWQQKRKEKAVFSLPHQLRLELGRRSGLRAAEHVGGRVEVHVLRARPRVRLLPAVAGSVPVCVQAGGR